MIEFYNWSQSFSSHIEQSTDSLVLPNQNSLSHIRPNEANTLSGLMLQSLESKKSAANDFVKEQIWKKILKNQKETKLKKYINKNFEINSLNISNFSTYCINLNAYINSNSLSYQKVLEAYEANTVVRKEKWKFLLDLHLQYLDLLNSNNYIDVQHEINKIEDTSQKDLEITILGCQLLNPLEIAFLEKLNKNNKLKIGIYCEKKFKEGFNQFGSLNLEFWEDLISKQEIQNLIFTTDSTEEIRQCINSLNQETTDIIPLSINYVNRLELELDFKNQQYSSFWQKKLNTNYILTLIKNLINYELEKTTKNFLKIIKNKLYRKISPIEYKKLNDFIEFKIPQNIDLELAKNFTDAETLKELINCIKEDSIGASFKKISKKSSIELRQEDLNVINIVEKKLDSILYENKLDSILQIIESSKNKVTAYNKQLNILSFKDSIYSRSDKKIVLGFNKSNFPKSNQSYLHPIVTKELQIKDSSIAHANYFYNFLLVKNYKLFCPKINIEGQRSFPSNQLFMESGKKSAQIIKKFYNNESVSKKEITKTDKTALKLPKPIKTEITQINISSVKDYIRCPYIFYIKHILKLYNNSLPVFEMNPRVFGTLAHLILEKNSNNDSLEKFKQIFKQVTKKHFDNNISGLVKLQLVELENRISQIINLQKELNQEKWEILQQEQSLSKLVTIDNVEIKILGRADRVDINHREKKIRILDFKASNKKHSIKALSDIESCTDFQLPIYANLLRDKFKDDFPNYRTEVAYINFPKELSNSELESIELTKEELELYQLEFNQIIKSICKQEFWPPNFENWSSKEKLYFVAESS